MTPRPPLFPAKTPGSVFDLRPLAPVYACWARLDNPRHLSLLATYALLAHVPPTQGSNLRRMAISTWFDIPVGPFTQYSAVTIFNLLHGAER